MQLQDMAWPDVAAKPRETPIVIPIAAIEQHGRHLPVFTDSLLLGEIVRRADEALLDRVVFTPLMWLGNSEHHLDFQGTMSASPRVYLDLLKDVVENLLTHGFRRVVLLNGHGGNTVPAQQALYEVRQKHRQRSDLLLLLATYWALGSRPHEIDAAIEQRQMGHACQWETSMILRLRPDLVHDWTNVQPVELRQPLEPGHRAWITKDRSHAGHIGDPRQSTPEIGETLFQAFTADVVQFLSTVADWDREAKGA